MATLLHCAPLAATFDNLIKVPISSGWRERQNVSKYQKRPISRHSFCARVSGGSKATLVLRTTDHGLSTQPGGLYIGDAVLAQTTRADHACSAPVLRGQERRYHGSVCETHRLKFQMLLESCTLELSNLIELYLATRYLHYSTVEPVFPFAGEKLL